MAGGIAKAGVRAVDSAETARVIVS